MRAFNLAAAFSVPGSCGAALVLLTALAFPFGVPLPMAFGSFGGCSVSTAAPSSIGRVRGFSTGSKVVVRAHVSTRLSFVVLWMNLNRKCERRGKHELQSSQSKPAHARKHGCQHCRVQSDRESKGVQPEPKRFFVFWKRHKNSPRPVMMFFRVMA